MRPSGPPELATWLMTKLVPGERAESLIGDLIERHQRGRSSAWYWRQALRTIATGFAAEMWRDKWLTAAVTALGVSLADIYMFSRLWILVMWFDRLWYPRLIDSRLSWLVTNPWAYRLQPYSWSSNIAFCVILAAAVAVFTCVHPRQRGLVSTLFLLTQLGMRAPALSTALMDWVHEPRNPIRFYSVLWFSFYSFVAVPISVVLGSFRFSL